jgi:hypothetical protein
MHWGMEVIGHETSEERYAEAAFDRLPQRIRALNSPEPIDHTEEPEVFDLTRSLTVDGRSWFLGVLTGLFLVMLGMTIHGETASFPSYPLVTIAIGAVLAIAWLYMHDPANNTDAGDPAGEDA